MASGATGSSAGPAPDNAFGASPHEPDKTTSYKGHPQPPINERLVACKIFLADEDINRCIDFNSRLGEVEDYLTYIEEEKLDYDVNLFRDVKIKAEVHRDWQKREEQGPSDSMCSIKPGILPISTRLISARTGIELQGLREAMGLVTRMREDHAPFSVESESDHSDFLKNMKDAMVDPATVDRKSNLLWVERRAYGWALRDPALIPYWMHPTRGIPKKGLREIDEKPWYVKPVEVSEAVRNRSWRGMIPHYLKLREDKINRLLKLEMPSSAQWKKMEELLALHLPLYLKATKSQVNALAAGNARRSLDKSQEDFLPVLRKEYSDKYCSWLRKFQADGVQLMESMEGVVEVDQPGVFYVPSAKTQPLWLHAQIREIESMVNSLLQKGFSSLELHQKWNLISCLNRYLPEGIRFKDKDLNTLPFQGQKGLLIPDALQDERGLQVAKWMENLKGNRIKMRLLRPGEMDVSGPGYFCVPWEPPTIRQTRKPLPVPLKVKTLERNINNLLEKKRHAKNKSLSDDDNERLEKMLEDVAYPELRDRMSRLNAGRRKLQSGMNIGIEERHAIYNLLQDIEASLKAWIGGFELEGLKIKIPLGRQSEHPRQLYFREPYTGLKPSHEVCQERERNINRILGFKDKMPYYRELSQNLLKDLQYPKLQKAYQEAQNADAELLQSTGTPEVLAEKQSVLDRLYEYWETLFKAWLGTFEPGPVVVQAITPGSEPPNDPAIVYHRGPLKFYSTKSQFDPSVLLDDEQLSEAKALADKCTDQGMPEGKIMELFRLFLKNKVPLIIETFPDDTKDTFIVDFYDAIVEICMQRRQNMEVSDCPLPPRVKREEDRINIALQNWEFLTESQIRGLEENILKFWEPQLNALRESQRADAVARGLPAKVTDTMDESYVSFRNEFQSYLEDCRHHGFRIVQDPSGNFYAPDPVKRSSISFKLRAATKEHRTDPLGANDLIPEDILDLENEINELLAKERRRMKRRAGIDVLPGEHIDGSKSASSKDSSDSDHTGGGGADDDFSKLNFDERQSHETRLQELLRPAFPDHISDIDKEVQSFTDVALSPSSGSDGDLQEFTDVRRKELKLLLDEFSKEYWAWVRKLAGTGIRIRTGHPGATPSTSENILWYPWNANVQNNAQNLTKAAVGASVPNPMAVVADSLEEELIYNYDEDGKCNTPGKLQDHINHLLQKRYASKVLSWDEWFDLYEKMRLLMPREIFRLYRQVRRQDERARKIRLPTEEIAEFHEQWKRFRDRFEAWLNGFGKGKITIDVQHISQRAPNAPVHLLSVQVDNCALRQHTRKPAQPHAHIPRWEKEINALLSKTHEEGAAQSLEEVHQLEYLLRGLWQPEALKYRQKLTEDQLRMTGVGNPKKRPTPEEGTVVESRVSQAYNLWRELFRKLSKDSNMKLFEIEPGLWEPRFIKRSPTTNSPRNSTGEALSIAIFAPKYLEGSASEFSKLARKLRTSQTISPQEKIKLASLVAPISLVKLRSLEVEMSELTRRYWEEELPHHLPSSDQTRLKELDSMCLWQIWGHMNQELLKEVLLQVQVLDPIEPEEKPVVQKWGPINSHNATLPPTEMERQELEIELNNLLTHFKNGTLSKTQATELDLLIRPLTDTEFQNIYTQILDLENRVNSDGLDIMGGMVLMELVRECASQLREWKTRFSEMGIFLDTWFFDRSAINDCFKKAMEIKSELEKRRDEEQYPCTGKVFYDLHSQDMHDIYSILKQYAQEGVDKREETKLLLGFIPNPLKALNEKIIEQRAAAAGSTPTAVVLQAVQLRSLFEDFIREYMKWYTALSFSQIKSYQRAIVAGYAGPIDFRSKAERRGIQRAAIELGLNLLATNQEQHRPKDRFRIVELPPQYQPPQKETTLSLPLEPWKRPVEQGTFEYTKKMLAYREWKDFDYSIARTRVTNRHPDKMPPPGNYAGPFALAAGDNIKEVARKREGCLTQKYAALCEAEKSAPRPLMQQMVLRASQAMSLDQNPGGIEHPNEEIRLGQKDIDLLDELTGPSWDEARQPFPSHIFNGDQDEKDRLDEFEMDVMEVINDLPLWQPEEPHKTLVVTDPNSVELFQKVPHNPRSRSVTGIDLEEFVQTIRNNRFTKSAGGPSEGMVQSWTMQQAVKYLTAMAHAGRIHFDNQVIGTPQVSRIPISGHPENKYVLSRADAAKSPGVFRDGDGNFKVIYNADQFVGVPIVQPNKYQHFQRLSIRLGREIRACLRVQEREDWDAEECLENQVTTLPDTYDAMDKITPNDRAENGAPTAEPVRDDISLERMALELHQIAPDLVEDAGFDWSDPSNIDPGEFKRQAAAILQMQILEEASNNWELRFPENESVWDFAANRLETVTGTINGRRVDAMPNIRKYFSMRRYPVGCQCDATQKVIAESGPKIEDNSALAAPIAASTKSRAQVLAETRSPQKKVVRHITGQRPTFPFGETPYQSAYLSSRMEYDFKDVPEFQHKSAKKGFFSKADKKEPWINPFALPQVPKSWKPDNVSQKEKHDHLIEVARKTAEFPNANVLEYFHTADEIVVIKQKEAREKDQAARRFAGEAIQAHLGKSVQNMTQQEVNKAETELRIDPFTRKFQPGAGSQLPPRRRGRRAERTPTPDPQTSGVLPAPIDFAAVQEGRPRRSYREDGGRGVKGGATRLTPPGTTDSSEGPARNTRSRSPQKRSAHEPPLGQRSPKKPKK